MKDFRVSKKGNKYFVENKWLFWWLPIYMTFSDSEAECWHYINWFKKYGL